MSTLGRHIIRHIFAPTIGKLNSNSCYNASLREGYIPSLLKSANVRPLPKQTPVCSIQDDVRPVSLTCQLAKVMEGLTLARILPLLLTKLDSKQFAVAGKRYSWPTTVFWGLKNLSSYLRVLIKTCISCSKLQVYKYTRLLSPGCPLDHKQDEEITSFNYEYYLVWLLLNLTWGRGNWLKCSIHNMAWSCTKLERSDIIIGLHQLFLAFLTNWEEIGIKWITMKNKRCKTRRETVSFALRVRNKIRLSFQRHP